MHPGRVVTTFVAADGLCEMLMGVGVGQIVNYDKPTRVRIGSGLIKVRAYLHIFMSSYLLFSHFSLLVARRWWLIGKYIGWPTPTNRAFYRFRSCRSPFPFKCSQGWARRQMDHSPACPLYLCLCHFCSMPLQICGILDGSWWPDLP